MKLRTLTLALLLAGHAAQAEDLMDIYGLAQQNDAQLKVARASLDSSRQATPLARSQLLPNIALSANADMVDRHVRESTSGAVDDDYETSDATLSLTQPVFRRDRFLQLDQAKQQVSAAEAVYEDARQSLMIRVAQAYFGVLSAQDDLVFVQAEKKAIERQLDQARQRFDVGLIAITDVHEAQAAYDAAVANEIESQNNLDNAWESLWEIVGHTPKNLEDLKDQLPLDSPAPKDIKAWSESAQENNPGILSAKYQAEAARQEIEVQRSGHYPTLDLVGSYSTNRSNAISHTESDIGTVGLQFALPLYSGGAVTAATTQARYDFEAAQETLDQQRRAVERGVRNSYRGVEASISRTEALKASTVSAESALEATQAGFDVGTRTIVDVLDAQSNLYSARRNYAQARYDYVVNGLLLKQSAGTLTEEDLKQLNTWLD